MTVCMRSKIFDSNWIMFALHYANAIIIIIIIISKSFKNKLNTLTNWPFMSMYNLVANKENQKFIQSQR